MTTQNGYGSNIHWRLQFFAHPWTEKCKEKVWESCGRSRFKTSGLAKAIMNLKTKPEPDRAETLFLVMKKEVSWNKATGCLAWFVDIFSPIWLRSMQDGRDSLRLWQLVTRQEIKTADRAINVSCALNFHFKTERF